jgi:hypothetical protein
MLRWLSIILLSPTKEYTGCSYKQVQLLEDYLPKNQNVSREADKTVHDTIVGALKSIAKLRDRIMSELLIPESLLRASLDACRWSCLAHDLPRGVGTLGREV